LDGIAAYIAMDSRAYARATVQRIVALTRNLRKFPRSGRKVPEFDDENLRELISGNYRIIYHLEATKVVVAAVIHGKRDFRGL
jgi:plasmid stabilization system protein ParE